MDTTQPPAASIADDAPRRSPRLIRALRPSERSGQAIVEFALVSMAFFMITLGTIDLGRAVYQYHQLTNAVRDGARFGKIEPPNELGIKDAVIASAPGLGLTYADIEKPYCTGGCYQGCSDVTVSASKQFSPILTTMFGWEEGMSITLSSSATVEAE